MATDLRFATSRTAIVSRGGSRQEVVERLVEAFDSTLAPPSLEIEPNPRRLELERELEPLRAVEHEQYRAVREAVAAEYRRPFEERLAAADDDEERKAVTDDMRSQIHLEVARRIAPHPRAAAIATELAEIDRADRQLATAMYLKSAQAMRHALGTPATPELITQALDRLAGQHKWQNGADKPTYLSVLAEEIEAEGFCAAAVAKAVRDAARRDTWVPSINAFLDACRDVTRALWAQVWLMESNDPTQYADALFHRVEIAGDAERETERQNMKKLAYNALRVFNMRDRAPPKWL
jgi:hypothetical protein